MQGAWLDCPTVDVGMLGWSVRCWLINKLFPNPFLLGPVIIYSNMSYPVSFKNDIGKIILYGCLLPNQD
jgi:hypothetical protein